MLGLNRSTLHRWIQDKAVPPPSTKIISGIRCRLWTETEITKLKEYKAAKYWGKGMGRKGAKRPKQKKT
jgi:predicted DNA-binding transcriptional regulator AlpA